MSDRIAVVPREQVAHLPNAYNPGGAARELFRLHDPEIIIYGGAGTGKTRASLELLNLCCEVYPKMRGLLLRRTRTVLTQTAMVTLEDEVIGPGQGVTFHNGKQEYRYPNGSVIVVGGLDDGESAQRVMSGQYDRIHVVECTEIGEKAWAALTTRLRNNRTPNQQIVGDCNPEPGSWIFKRGQRGDCVLLRSVHADNPSVTAQYLAILGKLRGQQARSLRDGEWGHAAGSVQRAAALFGLPERDRYGK